MPVRYPALNKHRVITSDMPMFVVHKAAKQLALWSAQWERRSELKRRRLGLEMNAKRPDLRPVHKRKIAESRTALAREDLAPLTNIFKEALARPVSAKWDDFKAYPDFPKPLPDPPQWPTAPEMPARPREPQPTDEAFLPQLDSIDKVVKGRREEKEAIARHHYQTVHRQWEDICHRINHVHQEQLRQYNQALNVLKGQYDRTVQAWQQARQKYLAEREQCRPLIDAKGQAWLLGEPYAVLDYCDLLLSHSPYPDFFPQAYDLDYFPKQKGLLIDYLLPPLRVLPRLDSVEYSETTDSFREVLLTDEQRNAIYAELLYEVPVRTLYEIFSGDRANAIEYVRFLGYIFVEEHPSTNAAPACILSMETSKSEFLGADLASLGAAECFERNGGQFHSTW
jgi:restriction system protein